MKVLVFEDNLMWSSRLMQSLRGFGHEGLLRKGLPDSSEGADVAIVNLGSTAPPPGELVARLHDLGVRVLAHAGHKEKQLLELGRAAGADILATNSELTFKLPELVERAYQVQRPSGDSSVNQEP